MLASDFIYDGKRLSDLGFIVCGFKGNDDFYTPNMANLSFNIQSVFDGKKGIVTSVKYDDFIKDSFYICKLNCIYGNGKLEYITVEELSTITRWLNQKKMCSFKPLLNGLESIHYMGSFNVKPVYSQRDIVGIELEFISSYPFGYYDNLLFRFDIDNTNNTKVIHDLSDEVGYIYADMDITCKSSGDMIIKNSIEDRDVVIKDCRENELISLTYPMIKSNMRDDIQDSFNFKFF